MALEQFLHNRLGKYGFSNSAFKYCNWGSGDDSTGDGSSGNPYKTINKAVDDSASWGIVVVQSYGNDLTDTAVIDKSIAIAPSTGSRFVLNVVDSASDAGISIEDDGSQTVKQIVIDRIETFNSDETGSKAVIQGKDFASSGEVNLIILDSHVNGPWSGEEAAAGRFADLVATNLVVRCNVYGGEFAGGSIVDRCFNLSGNSGAFHRFEDLEFKDFTEAFTNLATDDEKIFMRRCFFHNYNEKTQLAIKGGSSVNYYIKDCVIPFGFHSLSPSTHKGFPAVNLAGDLFFDGAPIAAWWGPNGAGSANFGLSTGGSAIGASITIPGLAGYGGIFNGCYITIGAFYGVSHVVRPAVTRKITSISGNNVFFDTPMGTSLTTAGLPWRIDASSLQIPSNVFNC